MRDVVKKLRVLVLRKKGLSYSEIGRMLGVSKQNVHSIEKRARRKYEECKLLFQLYNWAFAKDCIILSRGSNLMEAVNKLFSKADELKVKLPGTLNDIIAYVKVRSLLDSDILNRDLGICIMENGSLEILDEEAIDFLRQSKLIDEEGKN